ncbi:excinuclease ABC subunit UvrC [Succinivibrio dextrinosolvens]|uniref:excinuclease ABC subunit UvrC n=1 Tax=Succinivibrio dextrinosolvens TaxID=83771 RepID=UPI001922EA44|nr:excinuclease ABC subunit UvrC [Succinivibrio dextrinosolvens]
MPDISFDYKSFLKTVPNRPGSYRMYSDENTVIYVGKAKDLKKRLSSYFLKEINLKTRALIEHIHHIEFTVTFSEAEAFILENNLIKKYQPHYNILLRDDKSYPYLVLSKGKHPGLYYYRGRKKIDCEYFGPYPDVSAAKDSLKLLQKLFPIRQCSDTVYSHRSRPCLMAQIGKCLAPCVPMSEAAYKNYMQQVDYVRMFLKGQNQDVLNDISSKMEQHAANLEFEEAAKLRDQLLSLRRVQESQSVSGDLMFDMDVIGHDEEQDLCCNHVLFIRKGRIIGTRSYYSQCNLTDDNDALSAFVSQFYLSDMRAGMYPKEIITDTPVADDKSLCEAIKKISGKDVVFLSNVRSERAKYLKLAKENARASLTAKLADKSTAKRRIEDLEKLIGLQGIEHMECYDISHTMGENTVASCVSFNREGPDSANYRRFNIEGITPGDDFAAMHQVLTRRFKDPTEGIIPDVVFIDGGRGQLKQAEEVIGDIFSNVKVKPPLIVAVAKGEGRKEGLETLIRGYTREEIHLSLSDPALQIVLHIRDESHRFAITGHRHKRQKARSHSVLENIQGIGPKRRQALLKNLGGIREVMNASVEELKKVPGISESMAQMIYDELHSL